MIDILKIIIARPVIAFRVHGMERALLIKMVKNNTDNQFIREPRIHDSELDTCRISCD